MNPYQPYIFAMLSACISSVGTIFGRASLQSISPIWVAGIVPLCGGLFFSALIVHRGPLKLLALYRNKNLVIYTLIRTLGALLFIEGAARTSGTNAVFLTKIEPYCVLLWSWILAKEKVHPKELILLLVHFAGAALLTNAAGNSSSPVAASHIEGDLLIAVSMIVSGASYFYSKALLQQYSTKELGAASLLFSGLSLVGLAVLFDPPLPSIASAPLAYQFLGLHFVTFTSMYILWLIALKNAPAWKISALRALGPLAGLPAAWLILGEPTTNSVIVGGLVVMGTSFAIAREKPVQLVKART